MPSIIGRKIKVVSCYQCGAVLSYDDDEVFTSSTLAMKFIKCPICDIPVGIKNTISLLKIDGRDGTLIKC